jgi:hypothetical protein
MSDAFVIKRYSHPMTGQRVLRGRWWTLVPSLLAVVLGLPVAAAPRLRCELEQAGNTLVHEVAPAADPYAVRGVEINGRFRFKAVLLAEGGRVASVDLYTWYLAPRRPLMLHQAKYLAPAVQSPGAAPFTGRQFLYSPGREREFQYACTLLEMSP